MSSKTGKTKTVRVPKHRRYDHKRNHPIVRETYTCTICGAENTIEHYAGGKKPKFCPAPFGEKYSDCQRESKRRMMAKLRGNRRQAKEKGQ